MKTVNIGEFAACQHVKMLPVSIDGKYSAAVYPGIQRRIFFAVIDETLAIFCQECFENAMRQAEARLKPGPGNQPTMPLC